MLLKTKNKKNDDNYNYEVIMYSRIDYGSTNGAIHIYNGNFYTKLSTSTNSRYPRNTYILPITSSRNVTIEITSGKLGSHESNVQGYRRIGTNS